MNRAFVVAVLCAIGLAFAAVAGAQGIQTGVITGVVTSTDGLSVPGATVAVTSPALQGVRSTVTDVNGVYTLRGLPPGIYTVTIELSGFNTITKGNLEVKLSGTTDASATMQVAGVAEAVTVVAETSPVITTIHAGQNLTSKEVDVMPVGRRPFDIAELAPGLTSNTFNNGQVAISGSFAYDNVFMINGVDVNDNLFGTANNLFIEDAIAETQVLTSGISAEYGRFSGGVINVVTKSGGNNFSGSYRDNLTNSDWINETPFETTKHTSKINQFHEGTFGGPVVKDRLWFFVAGRREESNTASTLPQTALPYDNITSSKRGEVKVTGTVVPGQTLQGSYINNSPVTTAPSFNFSVDPATIIASKNPNRLFAATYNGIAAKKYYVSAQYSEKKQGFRDNGGSSTAVIDSPILTRGVQSGVPVQQHYNAPYFDNTDPEDRNNRQLTGSVAYTLSSKNAGTHDFKGGAERYTSTRTGGNSQTATGFVFQTDYKLGADGKPLLDSNSHPIPVFSPGTVATASRVQQWLPTRGAQIDITTTSFYFQDRWVPNARFTVEAGVRYERVRSEATGDINAVNTDTVVPRLGATYSLGGTGKTVLQATYGHYAGKYSEAQFARNTAVGNPSVITRQYIGPPGEGRNFAAGFDLANYATILSGSFPTANIFFEDGLSSPVIREFTTSVGRELGAKGYVKAVYAWRTTTNFVDDFITLDNGKTTVVRDGVNYGTFDNVVYRNTDLPVRNYQGLELLTNYRVVPSLQLFGSWTVQIKNEGNFEGENTNQPAIGSLIGDYPEILVPDRDFPEGRLNQYQQQKGRFWLIYNRPLGRFGSVDLAPVWRINSGLSYSLSAAGVPLSAQQLARNPGYARLPGGGAQTLFFGERGSQDYPGYSLVDFSATYTIPVWKTVRPWLKAEIYNVFNNDKLIGWDRTVSVDPASALDADGLATGYLQGARFGQARSSADYPQYRPNFNGLRAFQLAFGIRF
jgi:hypothetical protein